MTTYVSFTFSERNDLKCIIRSHAEVKGGCGLSHAGCYTVFSAPLEEKGIMGGLIELRGDTLSLQGNIFKACSQEEAVAFIEGRSNDNIDLTMPVEASASLEVAATSHQ